MSMWTGRPCLSWISQVDINLAPLVDQSLIANEIKWIEAALVKVPTIASHIGAFSDKDDSISDARRDFWLKMEWKEKLKVRLFLRIYRELAENAYAFVLENCSLDKKMKW